LDEAALLYQRILDAEPDNVGCLFHQGLIAQQQGRHDDALLLLNRAVARNGKHPGIHDTLGTSFLAVGRLTDAIASHRRALAIKPDFFEACYNLGNAYQRQGDIGRATACFRQTLAQRPDLAEPYNNLGNLLASEKKFDAAAMAFRRAIAILPKDAAAYNNLGNVFKERDQFGSAAICFEQALHVQPEYVEAHYNLGNTLLEAAMLDQAIVAFRRAVAMRPDLTEAYNNLGTALYLQEHAAEAIACFERALWLNPRFPETHSNMGTVFRDRGDLDRAEAIYRHAIALDPDYVLAHCNLAVTLLLRGDYAEGLSEFEWRRLGERNTLKPRADLPPRWAGEDPAGRTILLQAEQGLGDVLQFARYATLIAAAGARVILEVYPPLKRLLASIPGVAQVLTKDEALPPGIEWHLPMMSAPALMGTRLETIPAAIPYLTPDAAQVAHWKKRLAGVPGLKVGLVWAGDPRPHDPRSHAIDRRRSIALARLAPLLMVPGVSIVSLQKGQPAAQMADIAPELRPLDVMETVTDFADTAALVANLDLVIAVDTSVAHLVGAMGKPVWILSRFDGCWRWLIDGDDSPWYPTARLFRQTAPGNWDTVIARLANELASLSSAHKGRPLKARKTAKR
jgi:tetratricopeptide (TPR) repeat protein